VSRLAKVLVPGLLAVAVYYAVFGGEYSMFELRRSRASLEAERIQLAELQAQIDSLSAWADSLRNDPGTLERVAREDFGMIKEGETLYRFAVPDEDGEPALPEAEGSR
jgi:cell division protein FtsB